ncbi:MAG: ATP-binding cassette domain-containing protein [Bacteroidaceae bacterium]|nr:ATP-binding cassette domain-containing protein [Bacteroidaceae bacterium]
MGEANKLDFVIRSITIGQRKLIENLSFQLYPGSIRLLKAPNGTGKSVLLSILAGFDDNIIDVEVSASYSNGSESFHIPKSIKQYRKYARQRIGYLSHRLFEESLAVKFGEEINFITQKYTKIPDEISKTIEYLKANNDEDLLVENMSKGHRQLLAMADVLSDYENYELILLDEPSSYLSDNNLDVFLQQLKHISQVSTCSFLIASNDERLFNKGFTIISLSNQEKDKKELQLPVSMPLLPAIPGLSIRIQGNPIGQTGKLPLYFDEEIGENESVLVTGSNGTGKTTFLNVCAGLMSIKGKIEFNCGYQKVKRRQLFPNYLSYLFQEPLNYEFRNSVDEILCKMVNPKRMPFLDDLYEDVLDYYSISKTQNPKTLSSGQLRMLWIVSMLGWSRRWILDEPDASLDSKSIKLFLDLLNIHIANKGTVIIVTHNKELYRDYHFRTIEL